MSRRATGGVAAKQEPSAHGTKAARRAMGRRRRKDRLRNNREQRRRYGLTRRDLGAIGAGHQDAPWEGRASDETI